MAFSKPITDVIAARFSCRAYRVQPIEEHTLQRLRGWIASHSTGPFRSPTRFELIAADKASRSALRGLGTYGFIRSPAGFLVGAMGQGDRNLEDLGHGMEHIILFATALGLGTCWLGGSFTKGRFAEAIGATGAETVPAVTSIGYVDDNDSGVAGQIRQRLGKANSRRLPWRRIFFQEAFESPLGPDDAGAYATPLEMVRLGPSASNKQPWRIVREGEAWHLYIRRSPGYRERWVMKLLTIADMQRIDAGIAMCHFELTARELGLSGTWVAEKPAIETPDALTEYIASWIPT